jgi:hypothetical protein
MILTGIGIVGSRQSSAPPTSFNMRNALSDSGKTTYDATIDGNWFEVSRTDYDSVSTAAQSTKHILGDDLFYTGSSLSTFAAGLRVLWNDSTFEIGAVPEGRYIFGHAFRTSNATGSYTATFRIAESFGLTNTIYGNTISTTYSNPSVTYFLMKKPPSRTSTKTYIQYLRTLGSWQTINGLNYPIGYVSGSLVPWTTSTPILQVLSTELDFD